MSCSQQFVRSWSRWMVVVLCAAAWGRAAASEEIELVPVTDGVYVYTGPHEDANAGNLGAVGNLGIVVGTDSVAIIDTGGSRAFGEHLRAIVETITKLPVSHVINTHVHPDHVMGNAAFDLGSTRYVGHRKLRQAYGARSQFYLDVSAERIGAAFEGSRVVAPSIEVADTIRIDLGGRTLEVTAYPTAHTDNDVTVLDLETGTLFAGDLLFVDRLPIVDGSLKGWLDVVTTLRQIAATRVVPGHGPATAPWPDALDAQERYLRALLHDVRLEIAKGGTIENAISWVAAEERSRWIRFDEDHPRNVTASFTELEWE